MKTSDKVNVHAYGLLPYFGPVVGTPAPEYRGAQFATFSTCGVRRRDAAKIAESYRWMPGVSSVEIVGAACKTETWVR
jgi:hypothetical protein